MVLTDHANLLKLKTYVKHKRRLIRWAIRLSQYNIELKHRSGNKHIDADHTSRMPRGVSNEPVIRMNQIDIYDDRYILRTRTDPIDMEVTLTSLDSDVCGRDEKRERELES